MKYMDYDWNLTREHLKFDDELNLEQLDWKEGDMFILKKIGNQTVLRKIDDLEKFIKGYK